MIELSNVRKSFGKNEILKGIDCELDYGIYGLLGPNGTGKTTLMRCMTNLYTDWSGEIKLCDKSIKRTNKSKIGYLPQLFGMFKELSVYDAMNYMCNLKGIKRRERKTEIMRCLKAVYLDKEYKKSAGKLSGGMLRRLGIAQALLGNPDVILFDEPTAGLDPEERMHFKSIMATLGEKETVIISTHIVEDIEACCDKVIVMKNGTIRMIGTCEEIKNIAQGKVYACKRDNQAMLKGNYVIEKQYEENHEIYYRVLAKESTSLEALEPTLEDGYMCLMKEI